MHCSPDFGEHIYVPLNSLSGDEHVSVSLGLVSGDLPYVFFDLEHVSLFLHFPLLSVLGPVH